MRSLLDHFWIKLTDSLSAEDSYAGLWPLLRGGCCAFWFCLKVVAGRMHWWRLHTCSSYVTHPASTALFANMMEIWLLYLILRANISYALHIHLTLCISYCICWPTLPRLSSSTSNWSNHGGLSERKSASTQQLGRAAWKTWSGFLLTWTLNIKTI